MTDKGDLPPSGNVSYNEYNSERAQALFFVIWEVRQKLNARLEVDKLIKH